MYTITCDGYTLLDVRDERFIVTEPKVTIEDNTCGGASFTIYNNHPYFSQLQRMLSVFEVSDDVGVIFRGRMTNYTRDFNNGKIVDLEGAMAYFNDSVIRPFDFPNDFLEDPDYITAAASGNVVQYFLNWIITQHNSQVQNFQKLNLGTVTVTDPNNYITRSSTEYLSSWEAIKSKLFESSLGGHFCIRYEANGNYIDYLSDFTLTNTQSIDFGANLLDLSEEISNVDTYTAIIPLGAEIVDEEEETEEEQEATSKTERRLTIEDLPDGSVTSDIIKSGDTLYSTSAVAQYGWIYAPISETTWDDVDVASNLQSKGAAWLSGQGIMLTDTVDIKAVDLHFTDDQISSFRLYRKVNVVSSPHGFNTSYDLTKLDIDLLNPQNTVITVGETTKSLIDREIRENLENEIVIEEVKKDIEKNRSSSTEIRNIIRTMGTSLINDCEKIVSQAFTEFTQEGGDYDSFRQRVESTLTQLANSIQLKFEETIEAVNDVDGDLQQTNQKLSKYFDFGLNGLTIKSGNSTITLTIDNDIIEFKRGGVTFGSWDGENFHTGNIIIDVNEKAQFGNFAFVPRSDGSLSFLKVGG